jgi:putative exporter of polyketide antibiotics
MFWLLAAVVAILIVGLLARVRSRRDVHRGHVDHRAVQRVKRESQERGFSI